VKLALNGRGGKVGSVLGPALEANGHELVDLDAAEAMIDFTAPEAVGGNVTAAMGRGVPCVIGTTGFDQARIDAQAREHGLACFHAPNFALGAVLMMRFAQEAAAHMPRAEALLGETPAIHSVRLPGLVAHQEVLFGGDGQLLTIRHDTFSREAFVPGVLLALEKLPHLPPGLTVGLEALL
jgi:4-hydroxy-tetrahydrodipicolinate reductase